MSEPKDAIDLSTEELIAELREMAEDNPYLTRENELAREAANRLERFWCGFADQKDRG